MKVRQWELMKRARSEPVDPPSLPRLLFLSWRFLMHLLNPPQPPTPRHTHACLGIFALLASASNVIPKNFVPMPPQPSGTPFLFCALFLLSLWTFELCFKSLSNKWLRIMCYYIFNNPRLCSNLLYRSWINMFHLVIVYGVYLYSCWIMVFYFVICWTAYLVEH